MLGSLKRKQNGRECWYKERVNEFKGEGDKEFESEGERERETEESDIVK